MERLLEENTLITSKTDLKGYITYANSHFLKCANYTLKELLGKPHNIIRHPDMPRCVFWLLWEYIQKGEEIFAFVKNLAKDGYFYWVFANVTPSYKDGEIIGYYSVRRAPNKEALKVIEPLYASLKEREEKENIKAAVGVLIKLLEEKNMAYNELILHLQGIE